MFTSTVAVFKLIWPFIKESMLEDGTVRDWVKRHWTAIIWIIFLVLMLLVSLYLADIVRTLRQANIEKNQALFASQQKIESILASQRRLAAELHKERESNHRMRRYLLDRCQQDSTVCHFLIDETVVRPNAPANPLLSQRLNDEWCLLVRGGDMEDESIRLRFLRECKVNVSDVLSP